MEATAAESCANVEGNDNTKKAESSPPIPSATSTTSEKLEHASQKLKALYDIHDFYYSPDKDEKNQMLEDAAKEVLKVLDGVDDGGTIQERSREAFIRGRALDAFATHNPEAEASLQRAVKLQPSDIEAWNALGHCFWKKRDLDSAANCFREALNKGTNGESLKQLSMLLRQLGKTQEEMTANLLESLQRAKQAVGLDVKDAGAWYCLGNAHVAVYFKHSHDLKDLDSSLRAYAMAAANGGENNPDLHFNKAKVLHYLEDYHGAAKCYAAALDIDPLLPCEDVLQEMQRSAVRMAESIANKGKLKAKKLQQLVAPLSHEQPPHVGGKALELVSLDQLVVGDGGNAGKAIALKLVVPCSSENPPERFVMADSKGETVGVSLYHLDGAKCARFGAKDTFVVLTPQLKRVSFTPPGSSIDAGAHGDVKVSGDAAPTVSPPASTSYLNVQITDPSNLLVNGSTLSKSFAPAQVTLANFDK